MFFFFFLSLCAPGNETSYSYFLSIFREEIEPQDQQQKFKTGDYQYLCVIKSKVLDANTKFHVVFLNGKPFVLSQEISKLLWKSDVLLALLQQKRMDFPRVNVSKEMDANVYLQLLE